MSLPRKRARRRIPAAERYAIVAKAGGNVPDPVRARKRKEDAAPEAELQHSLNSLLKAINLFQFRLSEQTLSRAQDWRTAGWPDSPMIIPLPFGLALLGPLELKREGEGMNPEQLALAPVINTQCTDKWSDAEKYVYHVRWFADWLRGQMERYQPRSPYLDYGPDGKKSPLPPR
jgi:hypothetical protein